MSKLIKYEFRKTMGRKLLVLGIAAVLEIVYLIGLYSDNQEMLLTGIGLLMALTLGGILFMGLSSVVTLHRDMNTKQSYMLFMTPNNCYKILGAKVVENGLSILCAGGFFMALGALDITLLFAHESSLEDLWNLLTRVIQQFYDSFRFSWDNVLVFFAGELANWFSVIMAAYLADVVSSALLNGKKYNGLLSFVLFLLLTSLLRATRGFIPEGTLYQTTVLAHSIIVLVLSAVMYVVTAIIMERKLSV